VPTAYGKCQFGHFELLFKIDLDKQGRYPLLLLVANLPPPTLR